MYCLYNVFAAFYSYYFPPTCLATSPLAKPGNPNAGTDSRFLKGMPKLHAKGPCFEVPFFTLNVGVEILYPTMRGQGVAGDT